MPDRLARNALKPLAYLLRSALGTNGLSEKARDIDSKLDALAGQIEMRRQANVDSGEAGSTSITAPQSKSKVHAEVRAVPPITKMEAVASLLRHGGLTYAELSGEPPPVLKPAIHGGGSRLCRQGDFSTDAFRYWMGRAHMPPSMHRKLWEWFFVADVLWSRGMLRPGSRGLGFGVGTEPLTALFAAHDCRITATDLDPESTQASQIGWMDTNQHAGNVAALQYPLICDPEKLDSLVTFRPVDMNRIPVDLVDFDFTWSACSLEHLGSIRHGAEFFLRSIECLRPGGICVHTTEFNLSSNSETLETTDISLYRRRDIEDLIIEIESRGHTVEPVDWFAGNGFADQFVDLPPFNAPLHLRLRLGEFDCTSIGIIVHAKPDVSQTVARAARISTQHSSMSFERGKGPARPGAAWGDKRGAGHNGIFTFTIRRPGAHQSPSRYKPCSRPTHVAHWSKTLSVTMSSIAAIIRNFAATATMAAIMGTTYCARSARGATR